MLDSEKKEFGGWWVWVLALTLLTVVVFAVLNAAGFVGFTVLEREVFEQSYQRSESYKERIATYEATLTELRARRNQPNLPDSTKAEIDTQIAAVQARLEAARRQQ